MGGVGHQAKTCPIGAPWHGAVVSLDVEPRAKAGQLRLGWQD